MRTSPWRGASCPVPLVFCYVTEKRTWYKCLICLLLVFLHFTANVRLQNLLCLFHVVVERVILHFWILISVSGRLFSETIWQSSDLFTLRQGQRNLFLCHNCKWRRYWSCRCSCRQEKSVLSRPLKKEKILHFHLGCRASVGEASSAARWADTGWGPFHNRGSQPTTEFWDVWVDANERARRAMGLHFSWGRAHTETDSRPEEREMWCCWHYRRGKEEEHSCIKQFATCGTCEIDR